MVDQITAPLPERGDEDWFPERDALDTQIKARVNELASLVTSGRLSPAALRAELTAIAAELSPESLSAEFIRTQIEQDGPVRDALGALTPAAALLPVYHGVDVGYPRPQHSGPCLWVGGVTPANAIARDMLAIASSQPVPWSPFELRNLLAWYDPTKIELDDGASVDSYVDSSGAGRDLTAWTTSRMLFAEGGLNGTPALAVTGAAAGLETETFASITGPIVYAANVLVMNGSNTGAPIGGQTLVNSNGSGVYKTGVTGWGIRRGGTTFVGSTLADADPHSIVAISDGAASKVYVDGVLAASGEVDMAGIFTFSLGGRNVNGSLTTGVSPGSRIGDVVIAQTREINVARATEWLQARRGL